MMRAMKSVVSSIVVFASIFVFHCSAQGAELPPQFLIPYNGAFRAFFDGEYLQALRQCCNVLDWLNEEKNKKLIVQSGSSQNLLKALVLMLKAQILSELSCPKQAAAMHEAARGYATKLATVDSALLRANIEFVEAELFRPLCDFGMPGFEKAANPYRSRQALLRCSGIIDRDMMHNMGDLANRLRGKQYVALAKLQMADPVDPENAEAPEARYADAKQALKEGQIRHEKREDWKAIKSPDKSDAWLFKNVEEVKKQLKLSSEYEVFLKGYIYVVLSDFVELRLAKAELQARLEREDSELAWGLDSAEAEFSEMVNELKTEFRAQDHPLVTRVRMTQAKWFLFLARRELAEGKANPVRVRSLLNDSVFAIDLIRTCETLSPRQAMECSFIELAAMDALEKLPEKNGVVDQGLQADFDRRRELLRDNLDPAVFEATVGRRLVDGHGCPRKGARLW